MSSPKTPDPANAFPDACRAMLAEEAMLREGGGAAGLERQHKLGRLFARERIAALLDDAADFLEIGLWAAYGMYPEWGEFPPPASSPASAGVAGDRCMVVANDATVKAGAFFPDDRKESPARPADRLRVRPAARLPGGFGGGVPADAGRDLPRRGRLRPDFPQQRGVVGGRACRSIAAIMGNCVAGGAYLPVLCDKMLMTEGSGLYLAGPALVKAAIGQEVDGEALGGAAMHAEISGTVDFREQDDAACLARLRSLVGPRCRRTPAVPPAGDPGADRAAGRATSTSWSASTAAGTTTCATCWRCIVDAGSIEEYKADYGETLVCAYAADRRAGRSASSPTSAVRVHSKADRQLQIGGVIYADSADKAARFVMDCNQTRLPIVFFQDVSGIHGRARTPSSSGIIRSGAKLVNAVSNSTVPKITVIIGGSLRRGQLRPVRQGVRSRVSSSPGLAPATPSWAPSRRSDARLQILCPQAAGRDARRRSLDARCREKVRPTTIEQTDIRYGAARGWVDAIIAPSETRAVLSRALATRGPPAGRRHFHTGVIQVYDYASPLKSPTPQAFWGDRPDAAATAASRACQTWTTSRWTTWPKCRCRSWPSSERRIRRRAMPAISSTSSNRSAPSGRQAAESQGSRPMPAASIPRPAPRHAPRSFKAVGLPLQDRDRQPATTCWPPSGEPGRTFQNLETGEPLSAVVRAPCHRQRLSRRRRHRRRALGRARTSSSPGRVADPILTVGPASPASAGRPTDYDRLAGATVAGHLIECGTQACGGISTDWLGLPGNQRTSASPSRRSPRTVLRHHEARRHRRRRDVQTVKEQLLYEIGDPGNYFRPTRRCPFSRCGWSSGEDRVRVSGATGRAPPPTYKVAPPTATATGPTAW